MSEPMTVEESVKYCHEHRDAFIKDCGSVDEGIRQFDCLVSCLESGHIRPDELADYGMEYDDE